MNREIPFDENAICDECGAVGAFDFMGDFFCQKCARKETKMSEQEVIELMKSSESEDEWKTNCEFVKEVCGGYPPFWYRTIILSGIASQTAAKWGGDAELHVSAARGG